MPLVAFYRHPQMADGHLNFCKPCVKDRVADHRSENIEKIQEYDRMRGLLPARKDAVKKRAHRYVGKYAEKKKGTPEQYRAHMLCRNAIRAGNLTPEPCARCGATSRIHAHHENYSKPLDVVWLCTRCHGERHREINEDRRRKAA